MTNVADPEGGKTAGRAKLSHPDRLGKTLRTRMSRNDQPFAPDGAGASPAPAPAREWIPIRSLGPRHRDRVLAHLLALDERSRYLRFGYMANDGHIANYVKNLDFRLDEVFGIFNRRLQLIALAHLAYRRPDASASATLDASAEFGVSVLPSARRRGYGARLFAHAALHARNRGVQMLFIHALTENTAMLKIALGAGATIERDGSESEAWLRLPPGSFTSHLDQLFGDRAAEIDYRLKLRAHRPGGPSVHPGEAPTGDG